MEHNSSSVIRRSEVPVMPLVQRVSKILSNTTPIMDNPDKWFDSTGSLDPVRSIFQLIAILLFFIYRKDYLLAKRPSSGWFDFDQKLIWIQYYLCSSIPEALNPLPFLVRISKPPSFEAVSFYDVAMTVTLVVLLLEYCLSQKSTWLRYPHERVWSLVAAAILQLAILLRLFAACVERMSGKAVISSTLKMMVHSSYLGELGCLEAMLLVSAVSAIVGVIMNTLDIYWLVKDWVGPMTLYLD